MQLLLAVHGSSMNVACLPSPSQQLLTTRGNGESMRCRDCKHSVVGTTKSDEDMLKLGYKTCSKARNEIERGTFVRGDTLCMFPERLK